MQGKLGMNLREWRLDTILDAGGNRSTRRKPARASMNENQIHIRLIWPDWKSNPGLIGERHGDNRCANPLAQITTPLLFLSRLNLVQKETIRSLIVYVVCSMYVYVCGILQNWSLYPHTLMYSRGTWTQGSLGSVTHVTSTDLGTKVIWGSMTFGSSFWNKGHCIHILWHIFMELG